MLNNRYTSRTLCVALLLMCVTLPCRAGSVFVEGDFDFDTLRFQGSGRVETWETDGVRVLVAPEGGVIRQGPVRLAAPRMVVWFDRQSSERSDVQAAQVRVYAEGLSTEGGLVGPIAESAAAELQGADALHMRFSSTLSFTWDAPLERLDAPSKSLLFARAKAIAGDLRVETVWRTAPSPSPEQQLETMTDLFQADHSQAFREEDRFIFVWMGDVHGAYGNVELRADAVVIWIDRNSDAYEVYAQGNVRIGRRPGEAAPLPLPAGLQVEVLEALESMTADEVYINPTAARGLMTRPELRMKDPRAPYDTVYVFRGDEAYLIDSRTLSVREVSVSTCGFAQPHYQFRGDRMRILRQDESTLMMVQDVQLLAGKGEHKLLWVPFVGMDLSRRSFLLTDYAIGSSDKFGGFIQTTWNPLDLTTPPPWIEEWTVNLDFYGSRGPAVGTQLLYDFGSDVVPRHKGRVRGYYVHDSEDKDDTGLPVPQENRGRLHVEHRSQITPDWRVDGEFYYLSDAGFLNEFFEADFEEEKTPESYLLARYLRDSTYLALLYKAQVNDFITQLEQTPTATLAVVGMPLGPLVYENEVVAGVYDLEFSDQITPSPADPPDLFRFHTDHKLSLPFMMGIFRVDPFVRALATWATESVQSGAFVSDAEGRFGGGGGVTVSTTLARSYGLVSETLNLNRLRHIVIPYAGVEALALGGDSMDFIQMDSRDAIDSGVRAVLGLRQRLKTKRLRDGELRSVDWAMLDTELVVRSSDSVMPMLDEDFLRIDFEMALTDNISIHSRDNRISLEDMPDVANFGFEVDLLPEWFFALDYDYISDVSSTVTAEVVRALSDRYQLVVLEQYEFDSLGTGDDANIESSVIIRRLLHEWVLDLGLHFEAGNDDNVSVVFGFGPAGWGVFDDRRRGSREQDRRRSNRPQN